jgi:hypothetical protein
MPHSYHTGPDGNGPKTGRKPGKCHITESGFEEIGKPGEGLAKRRNSGGDIGKGKRIKNNQNNNNQ